MALQGAANVDCVTVWFLGEKTNETVSPTVALMLDGLNTRPPEPTVTLWVSAEARLTKVARAAEARAKRISILVFWCFRGGLRQGRLRDDQKELE